MRNIVLMQGILGSGKSRIATTYCEQGYQLVCRDDLKQCLSPKTKHRSQEELSQLLMEATTAQIRLAITRGLNIVIDQCHVREKHLRSSLDSLSALVAKAATEYTLTFHRVATEVGACLLRRKNIPGEVIITMQQHLLMEGIPYVSKAVNGELKNVQSAFKHCRVIVSQH